MFFGKGLHGVSLILWVLYCVSSLPQVSPPGDGVMLAMLCMHTLTVTCKGARKEARKEGGGVVDHEITHSVIDVDTRL